MAKRKQNNKGAKKNQSNSSASFFDKLLSKWNNRSPLLSYVFGFILFMFIFYLFFTSTFFQEQVFKPINTINATLASFILNILGQGTTSAQQIIQSDNFSVDIAIGCDGVEPTMMYVVAVALTPVIWMKRLKGVVIGAFSCLLYTSPSPRDS